jgi:hypothetical protein
MGVVGEKFEESVGQVWALIPCLLQFVPESPAVLCQMLVLYSQLST